MEGLQTWIVMFNLFFSFTYYLFLIEFIGLVLVNKII